MHSYAQLLSTLLPSAHNGVRSGEGQCPLPRKKMWWIVSLEHNNLVRKVHFSNKLGTSLYYSFQTMAGFCYKFWLAVELTMLKCCCKLHADIHTLILAFIWPIIKFTVNAPVCLFFSGIMSCLSNGKYQNFRAKVWNIGIFIAKIPFLYWK